MNILTVYLITAVLGAIASFFVALNSLPSPTDIRKSFEESSGRKPIRDMEEKVGEENMVTLVGMTILGGACGPVTLILLTVRGIIRFTHRSSGYTERA